MKIEKVVIHNYKSHAHTEIEDLGDLVSFIGDNGHGKSNVFKAIVMTVTNAAWPEHHLRRGQKDGYVEVWFSDGRMIRRSREKSKQMVELRHEDGRTETFQTIKDATELVVAFTGFHSIQLERTGKAECIQIVPLEDTAPFLISGNSDQTIRRKIETLASGAKIERAKGVLESEARKLRADLDTCVLLVAGSERVVGVLEDTRWETVNTSFESANTIFDQIESKYAAQQELATLEEAVLRAAKVRPLGDKAEAVSALLDQVEAGLEIIQTKRTKLETFEILDERVKAGKQTLIGLYEEEDRWKAEVDKLETALALTTCATCNKLCYAGVQDA